MPQEKRNLVNDKHLHAISFFQGSISSTFYARLFHTKVSRKAFLYFFVGMPHFAAYIFLFIYFTFVPKLVTEIDPGMNMTLYWVEIRTHNLKIVSRSR
jgi:hypothetical protein